MHRPSWTIVISGIFMGYIVHSLYSISFLFVAPSCVKHEPCMKSYLHHEPKLQLHFFISPMSDPIPNETEHVYSTQEFNYTKQQSLPVSLKIPAKTRQNGTLFLHIIIVPDSQNRDYSFIKLKMDPYVVYTRIKLTQFIVPEAEVFNLLGEKMKITKKTALKQIKPQTISHLRSQVTFTMITDISELPHREIPAVLFPNLRLIHDNMFLPIINYDFLHTRHKDLVKITSDSYLMNVTIEYTPISIGYLRLMYQVKASIEAMKTLGFSDSDIDDAKGIFADTNIYLLISTIFIASMHMMFDFLAFKNDINFWRSKGSFEGLSVSTIVWRAFSQTIIFFYLINEGTSLLILIPSGISTLIEFWKMKKVLRLEIVRYNGIIPKLKLQKNKEIDSEETKTRKYDSESLYYLMYLLYPLIIAGAIYSLIYQPHKSWYSWCINSLVNGVYAFGFLFMLPQLFVNYKLKSVAHLPWRAFMYKAFNTFIDDVFAFIITMPVAHRVACFRDDAIFLVYLYQRWLYPVDKSRRDTITITEEVGASVIENKTSLKKLD
ncbi:hypothetical protein PV327_007333 [Microctonus hyperodae]|uniref:Lipid scramblase CLPTM1L n=1 Tax=Microctonus hyperodae TaxID=165561 RepID=A0AA39F658_MICHY|nr:hypothetical protein PV327_007333 [Microctonus hyperodae]